MIESYLEAYADSSVLDIDVFESGDSLIKYIASKENAYNIYFLDIEMPGRNGIQTAKIIRESDDKAIIIFITQHRDYVYEVFEALPFRFLVKPINLDELSAVCSAAFQHIKRTKQYFVYKKERRAFQIPFDEIEYFESVKRRVILHTDENHTDEFYGKLSEVEKELDGILFVRIGVSYIVNIERIIEINASEIYMKSGMLLTISKRYKKTVKEKYFFYTKWRNGGDQN